MRLLEAGRGGDGGVVVALAALFVANLVERRERLLADLSRLQEDLRHDVRRDVREAWQIAETLKIQDII